LPVAQFASVGDPTLSQLAGACAAKNGRRGDRTCPVYPGGDYGSPGMTRHAWVRHCRQSK